MYDMSANGNPRYPEAHANTVKAQQSLPKDDPRGDSAGEKKGIKKNN